jgi:uncharacterized coiled-coil protein SlyX
MSDGIRERGRYYDIIVEALVDYDEWMYDDDYDATTVLNRIMKRMRERLEMSDPPARAADRIEALEKHKRLQTEDVMHLGAALGQAQVRIEQLEAEVERWHRVAMEAGAITCSDGRHIYPRRERIEVLEKHKRLQMEDVMNLGAQLGQAWLRIEQLEAALRAIIIRCEEGDKKSDWLPTISNIARAALDQTDAGIGCGKSVIEPWSAALDQSSPPARQENDDVFKGFRGNNEA